MRLIADQEHGAAAVPEPVLEVMPDLPGVAHAACGDDDMKAGQFCDRFAFIDGLGKPQMRRIEQTVDVDIYVEACGVFPEHFGGVDSQR